MSTNEILLLLEAERNRLDKAIEALRGIHRGKPAGSRARRGGMSVAARKAQSERMRAYWAKRKKSKAAPTKKKA